MPDHWQETTLGEVLNECRNGLQYSNDPSAGGLPISRIQTISGGRINLEKVGFAGLSEADASRYMLKAGDILFSHINSAEHVGNSVLVENRHLPLVHGMNLLRLRSGTNCLSGFLILLITDPGFRGQVRGRSKKAVNQVSINQTALRELPIALPPLPEQRRIVDVVGSIDSYISALEEQLGATRNARAALLYDLLSHPGDDWQETTLGHVARVVGGSTPSTKISEFWEGNVPWVTTSELTENDDRALWASERMITVEAMTRGGAKQVRAGTTLLGTTATIGTVGIAGADLCFNQQISGLEVTSDLLTDVFLFIWTRAHRQTFSQLAAGTSFKRVSSKDIKMVKILIPPIHEQRRIVDVVGSFDVQVEALVAQLGAARRLRSGVLSELLSGERLLDESYDVVVGL